MTRCEAKAIALKIVAAWHWHSFPVSGSVNGYRVVGTRTGRMTGPNRNGDIILADLTNHPDLVAMRNALVIEHQRQNRDVDMLMGIRDRALMEQRLVDYARADAELTAYLELAIRQQMPVITAIQTQ